ncbi:MAG: transglycosylase SLT domain-containing protein [Candidatus Woesearchaeota archaeon]
MRRDLIRRRNRRSLLNGIASLSSAVVFALILASSTGSSFNNRENLDSLAEDSTAVELTNEAKYVKVETPRIGFELSDDLEGIIDRRADRILRRNSNGDQNFEYKSYSEARSKLSSYMDYVNSSGIDTSFAYALAIAESMGDPRAKSPTGPKGLYQFNAETAKRNGAVIERDFDTRYLPNESIKMFRNHIMEIKEEYKERGNNNPTMEQVLVTYHDGVYTKLSGNSLLNRYSHLRDYIAKTGALMKLIETNQLGYEQRELFSKKIENTRPYSLGNKETFNDVSIKHNVPVDELKIVNLDIKNYNRISAGYRIRVPN